MLLADRQELHNGSKCRLQQLLPVLLAMLLIKVQDYLALSFLSSASLPPLMPPREFYAMSAMRDAQRKEQQRAEDQRRPDVPRHLNERSMLVTAPRHAIGAETKVTARHERAASAVQRDVAARTGSSSAGSAACNSDAVPNQSIRLRETMRAAVSSDDAIPPPRWRTRYGGACALPAARRMLEATCSMFAAASTNAACS